MQRIEAIPFSSFKQKIKLVANMLKFGKVEVCKGFIVVEHREECDDDGWSFDDRAD